MSSFISIRVLGFLKWSPYHFFSIIILRISWSSWRVVFIFLTIGFLRWSWFLLSIDLFYFLLLHLKVTQSIFLMILMIISILNTLFQSIHLFIIKIVEARFIVNLLFSSNLIDSFYYISLFILIQNLNLLNIRIF